MDKFEDTNVEKKFDKEIDDWRSKVRSVRWNIEKLKFVIDIICHDFYLQFFKHDFFK